MTTQIKTVSKTFLIILLVAAVVFTVFSTCFISVAFAAATDTTYYWRVEDSDKNILVAETSTTKKNVSGNVHKIMDANPWFTFDGWYLERERINKVSPIMDGSTNGLKLYGAYVFNYGAGDVNGDGKVNGNDVTRYCEYIVDRTSVTPIPKGKEWDYSKNSTYTSAPKLFFECNASVYNNSSSALLNLTYLRMAVAGKYGLQVVDNEVIDDSQFTTVYFYNFDNWTPYVHVWGEGYDYTSWPGIKMTSIGNYWYSAQIPNNLTRPKVIFSNNGGTKTADLSFDSSTPYYSFEQWYSTQSSANMVRVYFSNIKNWSTIKLYYWGGTGAPSSWNNSVTMKQYAPNYSLYYYDIRNDNDNIIFHNGLGSDYNQTNDIKRTATKPYYRLTTQSSKWNWESYNAELHYRSSTFYYYNPQASCEVYAHFNGATSATTYPMAVVKMTAVFNDPGWYSCSVPTFVNTIGFGSKTSIWDTASYIDEYNTYYSGGWKSASSKDTSSYMIIDGSRYPMLYGSSEDTLFKVELKAGQRVSVFWRDGVDTTLDSYSTNVKQISKSVYEVTADGFYDFYCKDNNKQVYVGFFASY